MWEFWKTLQAVDWYMFCYQATTIEHFCHDEIIALHHLKKMCLFNVYKFTSSHKHPGLPRVWDSGFALASWTEEYDLLLLYGTTIIICSRNRQNITYFFSVIRVTSRCDHLMHVWHFFQFVSNTVWIIDLICFDCLISAPQTCSLIITSELYNNIIFFSCCWLLFQLHSFHSRFQDGQYDAVWRWHSSAVEINGRIECSAEGKQEIG